MITSKKTHIKLTCAWDEISALIIKNELDVYEFSAIVGQMTACVFGKLDSAQKAIAKDCFLSNFDLHTKNDAKV